MRGHVQSQASSGTSYAPQRALRPLPTTIPQRRRPQQRHQKKEEKQHTVSTPQLSKSPTLDVDLALIESRPWNQLIQHLFRSKMAAAVGGDVTSTGYDAIIDLTRKLNTYPPTETQARTVQILKSLFPSWLLPVFKVLFSRPFPIFANKLNAWATTVTCEWLMGPCKVNDVEVDDGQLGVGQGVEVQRCRYLEQSGCKSICVNSCKVPTQTFFAQEMGLQLTMTPNYEDLSCQFAFGKTPLPQTEDPAFSSPCFSMCPSSQREAPYNKVSAFAQLQQLAAQVNQSGAGGRTPADKPGSSSGNDAVIAQAAGKCHKVKAAS